MQGGKIEFFCCLYSRRALIIISLIVLMFNGVVGRYMVEYFFVHSVSVEAAQDLSDGSAILLVAFGVMLECRGVLVKWFCNKLEQESHYQSLLNEVCERYGIVLLVIGLLMEFICEIYAIKHHWGHLFSAGVYLAYINLFLYLVAATVLLMFIIKLFRSKKGKVTAL